MKTIKTVVIAALMLIIIQVSFATIPQITQEKIDELDGGKVPGEIMQISVNVWGVAKVILQVSAVAALIFVGIKYMYSSSENKADLKKSLTMVVIGVIIVFGSTIVIDVIKKIFEDLSKTT